MDIYYIDGKFVPADQAVIPVNDLAVLRGYGVFDFMKTYNGVPFLLKEHLQRLSGSAEKIGLAFPWSQSELAEIIIQTLKKNTHETSNIRIVVTGGPTSDYMTPLGKPRLLVLVTPSRPLPSEWYTDGIKIITISIERSFPDAKSLDYIPATLALKAAREADAVEAVYIDRHGFVKEGTTSNIFAFFDDTLVTPGHGILHGITRQVVLQLAEKRYPTQIKAFNLNSLLEAREVFITGSGKGLVPVVQINEQIIGDGRPGPKTSALMSDLTDYTASYGAETG